jgi:hypothetical protein
MTPDPIDPHVLESLAGVFTFEHLDEVETTMDRARALAADPTVSRCMVQQVFTFALGRPPGVEDLDDLDRIHAAFVAGDLQFEALATAIVRSRPFRYQGGPP